MVNKREIAVSGVSGRWPQSDSLDEFWENLKKAKPLYQKDNLNYCKVLTAVPKSRGCLKNPKLFDASFFGYSEQDATNLDAQFRVLHEVVYEALWDAGIVPETWRSTQTGLFVGSFTDDTDAVIRWDKGLDFIQLSASRISHYFDFKGPSVRCDTACASSLTALHQAVTALQSGQCDQAIVAGVAIHQRLGLSLQGYELDFFSKSGYSRSLDAAADGYVRSEAIVAVVLQWSDLAKRTYMTIKGSAANADGYKVAGITSPSAETQAKVMRAALADAGVSPAQVNYIEAHATSTQAGDKTECSSILEAYGASRPLLIGCLKSNIGHTEAASGLSAVSKVIKIFQNLIIPPNIGFKTPNPKIEGLKTGQLVPVLSTIPFTDKIIGINSFGYGGANVHALVECTAPEPPKLTPSQPRLTSPRLVCFCNRTSQGIDKMFQWITSETNAIRPDCLALLDDISATLTSTGMIYRGYVILDTKGKIIKLDKSLAPSNSSLTISLDPSLVNQTKLLATLPSFKASCNASREYLPKNFISNEIETLITFIGLIDTFKLINLNFSLSAKTSCINNILSAYYTDQLTRKQIIDQFTVDKNLSAKINQLNNQLHTQLTNQTNLHLTLGSSLTLTGNGNTLVQSKSNQSDADWLNEFLSTLGILYLHGLPLKLSELSEKFNYPVYRDCPSLGGLINWFHLNEYPVTELSQHFFETPKHTYHRIDLLDPEYFNIKDHIIDDRCVMPATGYIYLIRKHLSMITCGNRANIFDFSFRLWKVNFLRAAFIADPVEFKVIYDQTTRYFEISTNSIVYVNGYAEVTDHNSLPDPCDYVEQIESDAMDLSKEEFYQEMAIACYRYKDSYQNVLFCKPSRSNAIINYTKDWIALADAFLQLDAFWDKERKLKIPTAIHEIRFDAPVFKALVDRQNQLKVYSNKTGMVGTVGMVFRGIQVREYPVKGQNDRLRVGQQVFCSLANDSVGLDDSLVKLRARYLDLACKLFNEKVNLDDLNLEINDLNGLTRDYNKSLLALLNNSNNQLIRQKFITKSLADLGSSDRCDDVISLVTPQCLDPLIDLVAENNRRETKIAIQNFDLTLAMIKKLIQPRFQAHCKSCLFTQESISRSKGSSSRTEGSGVALSMYRHRSLDLLGGLAIPMTSVPDDSAIIGSMNGNFSIIIVRESLTDLERQISQTCGLGQSITNSTDNLKQLMHKSDYIQIGEVFCPETGIRSMLFRRRLPAAELKMPVKIIQIDGSSECNWVDLIKKASESIDEISRLWLVADGSYQNGLIGLANCLALEQSFGPKVRCLFLPDGRFSESILTEDLRARDLLINVYYQKTWGYFRIIDIDQSPKTTNCPYIHLVRLKSSEGKIQWNQDTEVLTQLKSDPSSESNLINVVYSALNFRDILLSNGRMPANAYPVSSYYRLGMEFSGVTASGQRIMALKGGKTFATYIQDNEDLFKFNVPDNWSLADAATVPCCYLTVVYALFIRGNLQPGETVLIHAGSGGVGLAAISVCLSLGCKVFTTVSRSEKKAIVQQIYPQLSDDAFADSRSTSFEDHILTATDGRGVDVVLNSLIHDKFDAGLRVLAEGGRFLDISKVDIYEDKPVDYTILRPNITIHAVCLGHFLHGGSKADIARAMRILEDGIQDGMVRPMPYQIYDWTEVSQAFSDMQQAKHIGKLLIQYRDEANTNLTEAIPRFCVKRTHFDPTKTYLIIGGLGGMGLEIASWMVERGARKLVLTSRSGIKTNYQRYSIRRIKGYADEKIEISISRLDASNPKLALRLIKESARHGPIGGIFNLAVVLRDGLFPNQTVENFRSVCQPKIEVTRNMDSLSRQHCPHLDHFVVFSSIASLGNLGQSNYGYANSYMERVCEARRRDGLPGLAIQWGPVGDVGVAVRTLGDKESVGGFEPQRIKSCLEVLDIFLLSQASVTFSAIPILEKDEPDAQDVLIRVSRILGIKDTKVLNPKLRLSELGMDSVQAIEVQEYLERNFNVSLAATSVYNLTIENLVKIASVESAPMDAETKGLDKIFKPLKTEGDRPVFFFPPAIFDFLGMLPLARGLERSVFGVDFTEEQEVTKDWETLTDYYTSKILEQWPNEPTYDFVSYSLGAPFAFEVARKIQVIKGEQAIRRLVFIDSTPYGVSQAFSFAQLIGPKFDDVMNEKEQLFAFLKRLDRKHGKAWRARSYEAVEKAGGADIFGSPNFTRHSYITQMKLEPKLKADALLFQCTHTYSQFEGRLAMGLEKSIDGKIETVPVESNHGEVIMACKDLLIDECNKFLFI